MDYKRFLCSIFLVVFLVNTSTAQGGSGSEADKLKEKLMAEAGSFGLDIDESKIETTESVGEGNDGIFAYVPLLDNVTATDAQIVGGDVYTGFQCMTTKKLDGCFKVRLTGSEGDKASFELVDKEGRTVATSTSQAGGQRARPCIHVWVNGVYLGCFDRVIIIIIVIRAG